MTQSVVGALRVNLGLDSAQFHKGLDNAQKSLSRARTNFMAVAGAAAALGGALSAMTLATGKTATEISRLSQVSNTAPEALQRWAVGAKTVGIEQEKLADILKDVNDRVGDFVTTGGGPMADFFENVAPKVGITADAFRDLSGADALQLYVKSLEDANLSQAEMTFYMEAMANDSTLLLPLLKNNASEMTRLADSSAALGAIMSNETVYALDRMNVAVGEVSLAFQGMRNRISAELAPAIESMAVAFTNAMREGATLRTVLDALISNLDRIGVYISVVVAWFGARYVSALVAARLATLNFAAALAFMRGALLRTGIGILVVGAGELVFQLTRLVERTGSWAEALSSLGNVAGAVWQGIINSAAAIPPALNAVWAQMQAGFLEALSFMAGRFNEFINGIARGFQAVPGLGKVGAGLRNLAVEVGVAASDIGIAADSASARAGEGFARASRIIADAFGPAREAVAQLRGEVEDSESDMAGATGAAERLSSALSGVEESAGAGGGGGASGALKDLGKSAADAAQTGMQRLNSGLDSISDSMAEAILAGKDMGESLGRVFKQIAADLLASRIRDLLGGLFGGGTGGGGGFFKSIGKLFSFDGGGYTGNGARTGGVDGLGGFPAILHPRETVIDHTKGGAVGTKVTVNNYSGQPANVERGPSGDTTITIGRAFADAIRSGGPATKAMSDVFGIRPQLGQRG